MEYDGLLYRALNPVYAREPLLGRGAERFGGRFNPVGTPALYTSLTPETAIRESNQVGTLQPTTLVAYRARFAAIFDTGDSAALAAHGMSAVTLADPGWRDRMRTDGTAPTQTFALTLIAQGYSGLLVPSFARGARPDQLNLVLWHWGATDDAWLEVVDDEGRLG
ncbi:RES family NAD+ phosphorylase [Tranquillimonas rosea]|uniref:RES family NAD+ phosphorylase n=1 Tax=Tranquillimonas rosea TaxID=641238 RepID=UPI003BAC594C